MILEFHVLHQIARKDNIPRWARHKYGLGEVEVVYQDKNKGTKELKKIIQFPANIQVDQEQEEDGNSHTAQDYLCGVSILDTDAIDHRREFAKLDVKSKVLIALDKVLFENVGGVEEARHFEGSARN